MSGHLEPAPGLGRSAPAWVTLTQAGQQQLGPGKGSRATCAGGPLLPSTTSPPGGSQFLPVAARPRPHPPPCQALRPLLGMCPWSVQPEAPGAGWAWRGALQGLPQEGPLTPTRTPGPGEPRAVTASSRALARDRDRHPPALAHIAIPQCWVTCRFPGATTDAGVSTSQASHREMLPGPGRTMDWPPTEGHLQGWACGAGRAGGTGPPRVPSGHSGTRDFLDLSCLKRPRFWKGHACVISLWPAPQQGWLGTGSAVTWVDGLV